MTIDMAKLNLSAIQKYYNEDLQDCYVYVGFDEEDNETVNFAIEIMCKYQKIKEIMDKRPKDMIRSNPTLNAIKVAIEDEKDT